MAELGAFTGRKAEVKYLTSDARSWVLLAKRWRPSTIEAFREQWSLHPDSYHELNLYGKQVYETRFSQSWGVSYKYSGSTNKARPLSESSLVQELIDECNVLTPTRGPYN